jgi:hypothetical protein
VPKCYRVPLEHTFWFLIAYLAGLVTSTTSHGQYEVNSKGLTEVSKNGN